MNLKMKIPLYEMGPDGEPLSLDEGGDHHELVIEAESSEESVSGVVLIRIDNGALLFVEVDELKRAVAKLG